ncbi:MAG TPA: copper amine oxidase N-terminal domain-containing protein [Candidatus Acidoferrales bacterium]|nr:copper amine oxidase N-terminal domain-containing protein [Candidatus Acidoferrales bacterium]
MLISIALALTLGALSPHAPPPLTIVINGDRLPIDPAPRFEHGVLYVPVRRTLTALGLPFEREGSRIETEVGSSAVTMTVGSRVATIGGSTIVMEAPAVEIDSVLFAPLRFFTDALGAQVHVDGRAHTVTIASQRIGRTADGFLTTATGYERFGTVSAVDVLSDPPTLTFSYPNGPKTVPIGRNAVVEMQDVNANVTTPGELSDVRPGDFARMELRKDGRVVRVIDAFGSRSGRVVAVAGAQFVLDDGQVVEAGRTTEIAINGKAAEFDDLRPGDTVAIRYNVQTNEVREILASRTVATASAAANGTVRIASIDVDATHPLRPGDDLAVTMRGTPGGSASFDIGSYVTSLAMHEQGSGVYVGSYAIPPGANFDDAPLIGHLSVDGNSAPDAQAAQTISAASTPPGIADFAPSEGADVNSSRPAIYATFASDAVPVNPSSVTMRVNNRDVTSECLRTGQFIQYLPSYSYPDGPVRVTVRVADRAGNENTKSWTFTIRSR